MTVVGLRTAQELRGRPCLELELVRLGGSPTGRKTLVRSRSFGERVTTKENLRQALAKHAERAAEKLRVEDLAAKGIKAFVATKRFGDPSHYSNGLAGSLPEHTARAAPFVKATRRFFGDDLSEGLRCQSGVEDSELQRPEKSLGRSFRTRKAQLPRCGIFLTLAPPVIEEIHESIRDDMLRFGIFRDANSRRLQLKLNP